MIGPSVVSDRRSGRRRTWIDRSAVLTSCVLLLMAIAATGSAARTTGRIVASVPAATLTAEPFGDYVTRLSFDVAAVTPALVTAAGPATLTVTGTMTNAGPEGLTNLSYRFQRGTALRSASDVRQELAEPSEPSDRVQDTFTPVAPELGAGGSVPFIFTVPITGEDGLAVTAPGVYPLMVNLNGAVVLEGGPLEARVGELHLLLTVTGVPGSTPEPGGAGVIDGSAEPLPVNIVWPLVDRPHLGVGGVFLDEDLQSAIAPGGRLSTLVDGLTDAAAGELPGGAVTVVIDPQLLDELDRMTTAYRVVQEPGAAQPPMTEMLQAEGSLLGTAQPTPGPTAPAAGGTTSDATDPPTAGPAGTAPATPAEPGGTAPNTTEPNTNDPAFTDPGSADIPGTVPGTGQGAAASFLQRLRQVAARYPVLMLPYGDPDVVALVRSGLVGEVAAAVQHGNDVATRVLGAGITPASVLNVATAYPINGAVDEQTLAVLAGDGLGSALLADDSVEPSGSTGGAALVDASGGVTGGASGGATMPAAIAQPAVLTGVDALIDQGRQSGWATRVNALTGVLTQQAFDGSVTPAVFTPDRRWSPDAAGLRVLTDLLATLGATKVIAGITLGQLAATATVDAVPAYPEQARSQELPAAYLDRVRTQRAEVASLRQSLAATGQPNDPALVLDPMDRALDASGSTAFRQDPAVGDANLATVESTTAGIRDGVQISSAGNSYTLASSSSPLVLTVQNNLPYNVPVRVEISGGERVGLTVSDPDVQVVPAGRSQQVKIPAEVSRSGQFQVTATLRGADGSEWGTPVELSVESTAYGALTVIIIVVAGGVLVLMVVLRVVQRVRARSAGSAAPGESGSDQPTSDRPMSDRPISDRPVDGPTPDQPAADGTSPVGTAPVSTAGARPRRVIPGRTQAPGHSEQVGTDRS